MLSDSTPGRATCTPAIAGAAFLSAMAPITHESAFDIHTAALRQPGAAATDARFARALATAADDSETAAAAPPSRQSRRADRRSPDYALPRRPRVRRPSLRTNRRAN